MLIIAKVWRDPRSGVRALDREHDGEEIHIAMKTHWTGVVVSRITWGSLKNRFSIGNATAWLRLKTACAPRLLLLLLLLIQPAEVQALDYTYTTTNGTVTITKYTGSDGSVTIPGTIDGLPVTSIGASAFSSCTGLTNVTIPNSVTSIGASVFSACTGLASVTIPNSVTNIGSGAFYRCTSLTNVTIPNSVTNIGNGAFWSCTSLTIVYFKGNAPSVDSSAFSGDPNATVYYLAGTTGWGPTFAGRPTVLWKPQVQTSDASFGVRTNGFGFTITGISGTVIEVEACTDLANPTWLPLQTNTLSGDSFFFSDPRWTNHPARFYRLRSP
jgi:hypothetical protein